MKPGKPSLYFRIVNRIFFRKYSQEFDPHWLWCFEVSFKMDAYIRFKHNQFEQKRNLGFSYVISQDVTSCLRLGGSFSSCKKKEKVHLSYGIYKRSGLWYLQVIHCLDSIMKLVSTPSHIHALVSIAKYTNIQILVGILVKFKIQLERILEIYFSLSIILKF